MMDMKKVILCMLFVCAMLFSSCADSKTFQRIDGTEFTAEPYGWMTEEDRIEGVEYRVCTKNIVLAVVFSETIVPTILLTGLELYEPESYNEKN